MSLDLDPKPNPSPDPDTNPDPDPNPDPNPNPNSEITLSLIPNLCCHLHFVRWILCFLLCWKWNNLEQPLRTPLFSLPSAPGAAHRARI